MNKPKLESGLYPGIRTKDYFALNKAKTESGIEYRIPSKSLLAQFAKNPRAWKDDPEFKTTAAMNAGSLLDCLLLTPNEMGSQFILKPTGMPNRPHKHLDEGVPVSPTAKKTQEAVLRWQNFEIEAAGKAVVTSDQIMTARRAAENVKRSKLGGYLLNNCETQVAMFHFDNDVNMWVKGMIDILPNKNSDFGDCIVDLKSTSGFLPSEFRKICWNFSYHEQAALYLLMYNAITGEDRERFLFLVSDSKNNNDCGVLEMDKEWIEMGQESVLAKLSYYARCVEKDNWPGAYPDDKDEILVLRSQF